MIKRQLFSFIAHWICSSLGMYLCFHLFSDTVSSSAQFYIIAGLVFSLINSFIRPVVKTLALPLSILTLGLSTLVINTAMVWLTLWLVKTVQMEIYELFLSSIIMSVINGLVNFLIMPYTK